MLGRPLGAPDDALFQRRVVLAALELLERDRGPVLEDFPEDAPATRTNDDPEGAACSVSFASTAVHASLGDKVAAEIAELAMWHTLHERRHGRSATGLTQSSPSELAAFLASRADGKAATLDSSHTPAETLRLACEELKTYYFESRMAQPGTHTPEALREWFWKETAGGKLLLALNAATENDPDPAVRAFSRNFLVPRAVRHSL